MLLTNRAIDSQDQVEEALSRYPTRRQIEIFFRSFKSGCKIEQLQLEHIDHLEPAILFYMLIARRILLHHGRPRVSGNSPGSNLR